MKRVKNAFPVVLAIGTGCLLTACSSLQSQMNSFDGDMRSQAGDSRWNAAYKVVTGAQFKCEPRELDEVEAWRKNEVVQLKALFSKELQSTVGEANGYYSKGDLATGDRIRQEMKEKYFGGKVNDDVTRILPQWISNKNPESGIPECLTPCMELAWVQMLSDRNLSRMTTAFCGFIKRMETIDINGGKKSIKEFDEIAEGFKKVMCWKDKIDLFMKMLADGDTPKWSAIDRSTYALQIKKMEAVRDQLLAVYKTKRWNTRVIDRKKDYELISKFNSEKDYHSSMRLLASHDLIVKPTGLTGVMDFDDQAERAKVASEGLATEIVKSLLENGLAGVQYHRKSRKGVYSMLVIGRTPIKGDKLNKRNLREAGRVAQMQARAEFVRFMNTTVSDETSSEKSLEDDEFHSSIKSKTSMSAKADVKNLVIIATGVDGDEAVMILGWRDPEAGNITPAPMHRVSGTGNLTLSPSVGAYL